MTQLQFFSRANGHRLAYRRRRGKPENPGVIFLHGLMSDMDGDKAATLDLWCRRRGLDYLRFDYSGHGQSDRKFTDCTIGDWLNDAIDMIDHHSRGPQILVGSSIGGWIMLLAALARKTRIHGLVGIATAVDATQRLWQSLNAEEKKQAERDGQWVLQASPCPKPCTREPSQISTGTSPPKTSHEQKPHDQKSQGQTSSGQKPQGQISPDKSSPSIAPPITLSIDMIKEARRHCLLGRPIPLDCPAIFIHGTADDAVSWRDSLSVMELLQSKESRLILLKDGDHRLSSPQWRARIQAAMDEMLDHVHPRRSCDIKDPKAK